MSSCSQVQCQNNARNYYAIDLPLTLFNHSLCRKEQRHKHAHISTMRIVSNPYIYRCSPWRVSRTARGQDKQPVSRGLICTGLSRGLGSQEDTNAH